MITNTWKINQLDRSLPDGLVLTAHWTCSGTDGTYSGSVYGTCSFPAIEPSDPAFIEYEDLTEATVLGWVHAEMGEDQVAAHEGNVAGQIDKQAAPTQASGLPW
jgi:hypothetical protein